MRAPWSLPPPPSVTVGFTKSTASAVNNITIAPASYNGFTFTPPVLSGTFTVPSSLSPGKHGAFVTYSASLEGFDLDIGAHKRIVVSG